MSEEFLYWQSLVRDLQGLQTVSGVVTIAWIAEEAGVEPRQVWRWKSGEDRPKGLAAVRLHSFHMKLCPMRQPPLGHSNAILKI